MNLQHRLIVLPTLLAAAALALTGCGGGDGTAKEDETELLLGPISQRIAEIDKQYDGDVRMAANNAFEEAVAACMKEQGFDYRPNTIDSDTYAQLEDIPEWDSEEFAKTYGYGFSTTEDLPQTSTGHVTASEEEEGAYWEALLGPAVEQTDDVDFWQPMGCQGEAYAQVGLTDPMASTVARDIEDLSDQVDQDDAVLAAVGKWSTCMADKGYDFKTPDDARASIANRLMVGDDKTVGEHRIDGDDLKALKDDEIATAVADHQCSADLRQVQAAVLARLETDYYAEHKTEVDAYLAQYAESHTRS